MPPKPMSPEKQVAYDEALRRIEACRRLGKQGTFLDLRRLGLTQVPAEIGQLSALTRLDLQENELTCLPPQIGKLTSLLKLRLWNNQLMSLPPEIGQLTKLSKLDLSFNYITSLPLGITKLSSLTELMLSDNPLASLPPEIPKLSSLTDLYLANNQLTSLPPEIAKLSKLTVLNLSDNQLTELPSEIAKLTKLKELFLHDNPALKVPPSILGPHPLDCIHYGGSDTPAKPAEILDYYFSTLGDDGQALREVKVILVGRGEVGKSSMVDVLRGKPFVKSRHRTDGIAITPWPVRLEDGEADLVLWDFGGQEIMHGTHQFFLTHRSLYVVMVDGRHDRGRQDAEYWLKLVRAFGGDSLVMVVMNRQKAHPFNVDSEVLSKKYGVNLDHFFRTDCEDPRSIKPLQEAILAAAQQMLAAEERFPARCWKMKTRLAEMKKHGNDYLSDDDYEDLCQEHGITDEQEQQKLLRRLADLGTVVSFPDDVRMSALSVLNPEWATDGIYRVVTNEDLREKRHGLLKGNSLRQLLPKERWPKNEHVQYVLQLMEKFDLCFPVDGDEMLVPELLPDKTPPQGDWDPAQCVVFQYDYPVLPHGVLPRFITRTHQLSHGRDRWRTGVVLADDGAEARVQADYEANTLTIWVRGAHADARRSLLKVIRHHLESIHAPIKELNPSEKVAVAGQPDVLVNYCDVILDERRGKSTFTVTIKGQRIDLPIGDLLNGVASKAERERATASALDRYFPGLATHHHYHQGDTIMNIDDHSFTARDIKDSQAGYTLTNCTNMIQHQAAGPVKTLLEELETEVKALLLKLPEDKREETEGNLELIVKAATAEKPNRPWYSVSSAGLLEAAGFVEDFSGKIAGTIANLTKALWPSGKE